MAPKYRIEDDSRDGGIATFGGFAGPKLNWAELATRKPTTFFPPLAQQPTTFSPPLALQQSVWDSIVHGNFIDAKIFAFSRRSREPGRVDTPKALFINTHVLVTACSYFQSGAPLYFFRGLMLIIPTAFDFSDGIATSLEAGFPPYVEPFCNLGITRCDERRETRRQIGRPGRSPVEKHMLFEGLRSEPKDERI